MICGGAQQLEDNVALSELLVSGVPVGGFSAAGWSELHLELRVRECTLPSDASVRVRAFSLSRMVRPVSKDIRIGCTSTRNPTSRQYRPGRITLERNLPQATLLPVAYVPTYAILGSALARMYLSNEFFRLMYLSKASYALRRTPFSTPGKIPKRRWSLARQRAEPC